MKQEQPHTKTSTETLTDATHESPVDRHQTKQRRKLLIALAVLAVLIPLALIAHRFRADVPVDYENPVEHFKWGSIGSEPGGSLVNAAGGLLPPYEIFRVLPQVCPDMLPGEGYASLGFLFENGHEMPIGVSRRQRLGFDQVGLNCAVCHTGTVRASPDDEPQILVGMPSHQLALQDFFRFVLDCTLDPRFDADNLLGKIAQAGTDLNAFDRFLFRLAVIPRTREQTLQLQRQLRLIMGDEVTAWGPGRVDTFNPYKGMQFNWQLERLPIAELTAASDFPSLWNQKPREGMDLHWDGNNSSLMERNLSASLGAGVTPVTIDHERLTRVREWVYELPPPEYPFPIDRDLVSRGEAIYRVHCVACHADHRFKEGIVTGDRVGKVEKLADVGTDPYRLSSYTEVFAANQYTLYPDSEYRFTHFKKTDGYANQPLDGIWARAPYLHNGSVPTLRALLDPPEERPTVFYRGYDVFDQDDVGFVWNVRREGSREYFRYDTRLPSNSNSGHQWGTDLPDADKAAIVEYMKTF
ncbi:MAG: cytochrome c [Acidobacteriota bacterium]|nr:cytochrome c [Acidobacteriota bacterium]